MIFSSSQTLIDCNYERSSVHHVANSQSRMSQRWALYIDVEGFGSKWSDTGVEAFRGINALMQGIYRIGTRYFPEPPERLFAHQFGDAFLVVSDFHEPSLDRAVLVATALLRHVLACGETAKAAISEGELSGIEGCYPQEIRAQIESSHISIGAGVMTVTPVLGSALINAVSLMKQAPSGPLLVMSTENAQRLSPGAPVVPLTNNPGVVSINWLRDEAGDLDALQSAAGFRRHSEVQCGSLLRTYLDSGLSLTAAWKDSARRYLLCDF